MCSLSFLQAGLAKQPMQGQPLGLILPTDSDLLAVADWSAGQRRMIMP